MNEQQKDAAKEAAIGQIKLLINSLLPIAGPYINEAFFELRSRIKQERINRFLQGMIETMKQSDINSVDTTIFKAEEFGDFIETLLLKVSRTKSDEKIKAFQLLFKQQIIEPKDFEYAEDLVEKIGQLQENSIVVLRFLFLNRNYVNKNVYNIAHIKNIERKMNLYQTTSNFINSKDEKTERDIQQIKNTSNQLLELQKEIDKLKMALINDNAKDYGLSEIHFSTYFYFVQDLINKGIVYEETGTFDHTPLCDVKFTKLGEDIMNYLNKD